MSRRAAPQVTALHRVIVGVCSALILVLPVGSLFISSELTEDPETHVPLDPRGAMIGIPIGLGGLVFSVAGLGIRRRRRKIDSKALHIAQRAMPRIDLVDRMDMLGRPSTGEQPRMRREQPKVFWTTPPTRSNRRRNRDSD